MFQAFVGVLSLNPLFFEALEVPELAHAFMDLKVTVRVSWVSQLVDVGC